MTNHRRVLVWGTVSILLWVGACVSDSVAPVDSGSDANTQPDAQVPDTSVPIDTGVDAPVDAGQDAPCIRTPDGGKAGALDTTFKTGTLSGFDSTFEAYGAAIDSVDRVFVVGKAKCASTGYDMVVYRLTAAGAIDSTFAGGAGKLCFDYGGGDNTAYAVATNMTADGGQVVLAGGSVNVDSGFFPGGMVANYDGVTPRSRSVTKSGAWLGVQIAPGDKPIINGYVSAVPSQVYMYRLNPDLTSDNSFSNNYTVGPTMTAYTGLAIDPATGDVTTASNTATGDIAAHRYPNTGTNPTPLAKTTTTSNAGAAMRTVLIRPLNGAILVGASGPDAAAPAQLFAVAQNGGLDTTFGTGGSVTIPGVRPDPTITSTPGYMQCDGKIVVVGLGQAYDMVARVLPNGNMDNTFGDGGVSVATTVYGTPVAALQDSQGRIVVIGQSFVGSIVIFRMFP